MEENNKKESSNDIDEKQAQEDKENTKYGCGCLIVILIIIAICGYGIHRHNLNEKNKAEAIKQEQQRKEAEEIKKVKEEAKKAQDEMPKINFTGIINPKLAHSGEKVVITVEVENTDANKTIKGIKLVFSNKNLLEKGLVITNIMNGGTRDGRNVFWNIEIPPKEKRAFNIVASANQPGEYETAITFKEYDGSMYYKSPNGDEELDGKLVVIP